MSDIRRFERNDWYGFAGAQKFNEELDPYISTFTIDKKRDIEITAIADAQGLEIYLYNDRTGEGLIYTKELELTDMQAESELTHLVAFIESYTEAPKLIYALDHPSNECTKDFCYSGNF